MKRLAGILFILAAAALYTTDAAAQLKIIPQEKLDSIASPPLSPDSLSIAIDVRQLNLPGMKDTDEPCRRTVKMTNISDRKITINRLTTSCSCLKAICPSTSLEPGEKTTVTISYNPKGHFGRFNHRVHIYTSGYRDPSAIVTVKVRVTSEGE